jgi:hypothetical protein
MKLKAFFSTRVARANSKYIEAIKIPVLFIYRLLIKIRRAFMTAFLGPLPLRITIFKAVLKRNPFAKFSTKVRWDAVARPGYSYGMLNAAKLAKQLGIFRISALEFGTASGAGLLEMERISLEIQKEIGVSIEIYGFDSMTGLPASSDPLDQVYFWPPGLFQISTETYLPKLNKSKIINGNVSQTVNTFIRECQPARIGFISFDLDYYSSTVEALKIFNAKDDYFLPRVECFMDDTASFELLCASDFTGVLKAIQKFNADNQSPKIGIKRDVGRLRKLPGDWFQSIYVAHFLNHPQYNQSVFSSKEQEKIHGQF